MADPTDEVCRTCGSHTHPAPATWMGYPADPCPGDNPDPGSPVAVVPVAVTVKTPAPVRAYGQPRKLFGEDPDAIFVLVCATFPIFLFCALTILRALG